MLNGLLFLYMAVACKQSDYVVNTPGSGSSYPLEDDTGESPEFHAMRCEIVVELGATLLFAELVDPANGEFDFREETLDDFGYIMESDTGVFQGRAPGKRCFAAGDYDYSVKYSTPECVYNHSPEEVVVAEGVEPLMGSRLCLPLAGDWDCIDNSGYAGIVSFSQENSCDYLVDDDGVEYQLSQSGHYADLTRLNLSYGFSNVGFAISPDGFSLGFYTKFQDVEDGPVVAFDYGSCTRSLSTKSLTEPGVMPPPGDGFNFFFGPK